MSFSPCIRNFIVETFQEKLSKLIHFDIRTHACRQLQARFSHQVQNQEFYACLGRQTRMRNESFWALVQPSESLKTQNCANNIKSSWDAKSFFPYICSLYFFYQRLTGDTWSCTGKFLWRRFFFAPRLRNLVVRRLPNLIWNWFISMFKLSFRRNCKLGFLRQCRYSKLFFVMMEFVAYFLALGLESEIW